MRCMDWKNIGKNRKNVWRLMRDILSSIRRGRVWSSFMISEDLRKEKCSVYFRMNGFSRIREEKKKVIWRRKKQLDQRGLPLYFQMVPVLDVWNNFMAKDLGVSKYVLSRVFSKIFHRNFNQYLNDARLGYAKQRLETTNDPITTIWLDSGFESQRTFNREFKEKYKVSPSEYRRTLYENLGEKMK